MKTCSRCRAEKPLDDFFRMSAARDGRNAYCKPCHRENRKRYHVDAAAATARAAAWAERHPDRVWATCLKRFGLTPESYTALLKEQDGVCAICFQVNLDGRRLAVDHDHACCPKGRACTRCVRGLLCGRCNVALGALREDAEVIKRAASYVRERSCSSV